jgi:ubiquitin carboxyl-terminal hydrolase 7
MDQPVPTSDMLIDDYEVLDEKQDVAIITPAESPAESESEPLADDYEAMMQHIIPAYPDLEVEAEGYGTWNIENWRQLEKKEHGPIFKVGGQPWRVLLFPYGNNVDHASFYLEQAHEEGTVPENWYSCVHFALVLWNKRDPSMYASHVATHRYNVEEGDWGFTRFVELRKLFEPHWEGREHGMIEDDAVNVTAYVRIYKDATGVLWHNFNGYDSKKETGMVGLKNQGATCYLNSLLQSLYFTNAFRKAVYQIPTEHEAVRTNCAWALQRLFYHLQSDEIAVSTSELTLSFGWEARHIFEQQDVQELSRILMDRMEERMKGTEAENALAKMFVGKMKTYISCINVDYESSRLEDFWDIQLNVSGNKDLNDSFKDYIQVETMDGENKYFAEGFGLQDAKKGVIFEAFPSVLHLQLKRFEYDINRDAMMKVNDRHEFPESFDAAPYLSDDADKSEPYIYKLHGVLVHSGDIAAGHYYAFIKPQKDGPFYKFDDDRVTRATMKEALDDNFGGEYGALANGNTGIRNPYTRTLSTKKSMSAYMLVYIRESRIDQILQPVTEADTPAHIAQTIIKEKELLEEKRKEREEQHLYLGCAVIFEDKFRSYEGFDLADWSLTDQQNPMAPVYYRTLRASTVKEFCQRIAEDKNVSPERVRIWVMVNRQNKTVRPDQPLMDPDMTIEEAFTKHSSRDKNFRLWAEIASEEEVIDGKVTWPETATNASNNMPTLVFIKHFSVENQSLLGVGHIYIKKFQKVSDMFPMINKLMGWAQGSVLGNNILLFEEIKTSMIEPMKPKVTMQQAEIQDGDIICFQNAIPDDQAKIIVDSGRYAGAREFYDYLLNRVTIKFTPKNPAESMVEPFDLVLNRKFTYDQFSAKVGNKVGVPADHIRFWTVNTATGKPRAPMRRPVNHNSLYALMNPQYTSYSSNQRNDMLFFEVMDMSLSELETRKALRISWVTEGLTKEEVFEVLVSKSGMIADLIMELKKKLRTDTIPTAHIKVYAYQSGKIAKELGLDYPVASVQDYLHLFAEVAPEDELNATEADKFIWGFHYDKDPAKVHGIPFKFYLKAVGLCQSFW